MDELLLWRWSTAVQITSAFLVAVFFLVVGRSIDWRGVNWWVAAWVGNAIALGVTWVFWILQPGGAAMTLLLIVYLGGKTVFIVLLLRGTLAFSRTTPTSHWVFLLPVVIYALVGGLLMRSIDVIGVVQATLVAATLGGAAWFCWRTPGHGLGWLGVGFAMRALLAVAEAVAYAWHMRPGGDGWPEYLGVFLATHSAFDTGAEWVIALGCVLALAHRAHAELAQSHHELHAAHEELRRVAERDPLTGLYNRRMLTDLLARDEARDAQLWFFDLDQFKRINDRHGHAVGDACLRRFAQALQAELPEAQAVLRFAGDEFLAIMRPLPPEAAHQRIQHMRELLQRATPGVAAVHFSVGIVDRTTGDDAQAALRRADLAMYDDKTRQRRAG